MQCPAAFCGQELCRFSTFPSRGDGESETKVEAKHDQQFDKLLVRSTVACPLWRTAQRESRCRSISIDRHVLARAFWGRESQKQPASQTGNGQGADLAKVGGQRASGPPPPQASNGGMVPLELRDDFPPERPNSSYNGTFLLLLLNLGVFVADHLLNLPFVRFLYLYHLHPRWYQFVTATFCHANWSHLSANLFFVYMFGKLVEELEGSFGVLATYIVTGVGANLFSWLLLPSSMVSVGASGAVFGLFAVSVLVRLSWDWRKLLEVVILGQFVIEKITSEAQASAMTGTIVWSEAPTVNHVAHLAGAFVGALLVWMLTRLPAGDEVKKASR